MSHVGFSQRHPFPLLTSARAMGLFSGLSHHRCPVHGVADLGGGMSA